MARLLEYRLRPIPMNLTLARVPGSHVLLFSCNGLNFLLEQQGAPHPCRAFVFVGTGGDFELPMKPCRSRRADSRAWQDCRELPWLTQPSPRLLAALSTIVFPIMSEAVAAGDGTFSTCSTLPEGTN